MPIRVWFAFLIAVAWSGQAPPKPSATSPDPNMARPIPARDSVFIEELTWLEVRDAMRAGKRTVIIATGGVEMNGPYLVTGKHNYILRATTEAVARKLGDALVAPIVPFVPEGDIDPPTGHMRYPGTISVREDTFRHLLADIASSSKTHGFEHVVLLGDSGGNENGMRQVAAELSARWAGSKTTIHHIPEHYNYPAVTRWLDSEGIRQVEEGHHDDYGISSILMSVDPGLVRLRERVAKDRASINDVSLTPPEKTIAVGRRVVEFRARAAVDAIRKAIAASRKP